MNTNGLFLIVYPIGVLALGLAVFWLTRGSDRPAAPKR